VAIAGMGDPLLFSRVRMIPKAQAVCQRNRTVLRRE